GGILDAGDADARAEPRGLDPERAAQRGAALAPAVIADRDEIDLRQPRLGEDPPQGQLVHADGGGEGVGADVRGGEPAEQALGASVLAEGPVQGGKGDVGPEQAAAGSQRQRVAAAGPLPLTGDEDARDLMAALLQSAGHRLSGAQRDLVLRGAAAG